MKDKTRADKIIVLKQVGGLGNSIIDHLIVPVASAANVKMVQVLSHHHGPKTINIKYRCPPSFLIKFSFFAAMWEFIDLFRLSLTAKPTCIAGYLLNPHGIVAFTVAKLTRKKVIISIIGGRPELYTKGSIKGIDFNTSKIPWLGKRMLDMLRHTDAIITTGSITKDYLVKHGVDEDKIYPIICPANNNRFKLQDIPKQFDVLSIGYLSLIKHHEILLRVIAILKKKYPQIKGCIVGNGPRERELTKLAKDLGVEENIYFAGYQQDVAYYYNRSKIFIHTSEREGFPNVVLEAMSCGLPCVVSNCGDIIDIVKDGVNSFVIQNYDDSEGFAKVTLKLLEDKDTYSKISRNALVSMKNLSSKEVTKTWESVLSRVMSE